MTTPSPNAPVQPAPQSEALDRLIEAQQVSKTATFEHLLGAGQDLWTDDEFERFLAHVERTRAEKE